MDGVPTGSGRSARFLRPATAVVAVLAFVAVFIALLLYITHFHRTWFNSDDAVLNMLADAMWQQGRLLPQHWINNNGDLLVPSGALLIAPLLRWFPNGFAVHAVAGVFAALLLTGSLAWLLRPVRGIWVSASAPFVDERDGAAPVLLSVVLADIGRTAHGGATDEEIAARLAGKPSEALLDKLGKLDVWETEQIMNAMAAGASD